MYMRSLTYISRLNICAFTSTSKNKALILCLEKLKSKTTKSILQARVIKTRQLLTLVYLDNLDPLTLFTNFNLSNLVQHLNTNYLEKRTPMSLQNYN